MSTAIRLAVGVDELKRAWRAVQQGQFRAESGRCATEAAHLTSSSSPAGLAPTWAPGEHVLPVLGCVGSAGASTTALALATVAEGSARVLECCTVTASGLVGASTAELGCRQRGWTQGRRGGVLLERASDVLVGVGQVPAPPVPDPAVGLTVLDVGWELGQVMAAPSWVGAQLGSSTVVVAVSTATVPGVRRLEGALSLLTHTRVVAGVLGPRRRRWPAGVEHSMGPLARTLDLRGDLVTVPLDPRLAVAGVDSRALPAPLLKAATQILRLTEAGAKANQKGSTP